MSRPVAEGEEQNVCNILLTKIPIPQEIIEEYSEFFEDSKDLDNYKFILKLDQLDSSSVWTRQNSEMDEDCQRAPLGKPVGMKTIDHYFGKKNILNNQKKNVDINREESGNTVKKSKIHSKSRKSISDRNSISQDLSQSESSPAKKTLENNEVLSQDIFDKNDSASSNEGSKKNNGLDDCEVIPCTQFSSSAVSKFTTSNLVSSGSCKDQSSSSSESDGMKSHSSVHKSSLDSHNVSDRHKSSSEQLSLVSRKAKLSKNNNLKTNKGTSEDISSSDEDSGHALKSTKSKVVIKPSISKQKETEESCASDNEKSGSLLKPRVPIKFNKSQENNYDSSSFTFTNAEPDLKSIESVKANVPAEDSDSESSSSDDGNPKCTVNSLSKSSSPMKMVHALSEKSEHFSKSSDKGCSLTGNIKSVQDNPDSDSSSNHESICQAKLYSHNQSKSASQMKSGFDSLRDTKSEQISASNYKTELRTTDNISNINTNIDKQKMSSKSKDRGCSSNSSSSSSDSDDETIGRNSLQTENLNKSKEKINLIKKISKKERNKAGETVSNSSDSSDSDTVKNLHKNITNVLHTERENNIKELKERACAVKLISKNNSDSDTSEDNDRKNEGKYELAKLADTNLTKSEKLVTGKVGNTSDVSECRKPDISSSDPECSGGKGNNVFVNSSKGNENKKDPVCSESKNSNGNDSSSDHSDENEYSFKNKDVGKMLGLNSINSTRNMSCMTGNKVLKMPIKTLESDNPKTESPLNSEKEQSCTEDSVSDSSSSEEESSNTKDRLKKINVVNDQSTIFAPAASSSFMFSTPDNAKLMRNRVKLSTIKIACRADQLDTFNKNQDVSSSSSEESENQGNTAIRFEVNKSGGKERADSKTKSHSDSASEGNENGLDVKSNSAQEESGSNVNIKRKRSLTDAGTPDLSIPKKSKTKDIIANTKIDVEKSSSDEEDIKMKRPDWLGGIIKNKRQVSAQEKLSVENCLCSEDVSSGDEIYTLQCPKELEIESMVGKRISLSGESQFEGLTKDQRSVAFETFANNLPSKINLLLPSKKDLALKLGSYDIKGSIVVTEKCNVPSIDMSVFSCSGKESSSDEEFSDKSSATPLPPGLKLRHPLHGLDYKKKLLPPNFDAVISREKKRNKKKKQKQGDGVRDFKKPLDPALKCSSEMKNDCDNTGRGVVIGRNMISLVSDDESKSLTSKERKKRRTNRDVESSVGNTSSLPYPSSCQEFHTKRKKEKKKKRESANIEPMSDGATSQNHQSVESEQYDKKKKKKKKKTSDKLMEQMIRDVESSVGITSSLPDPSSFQEFHTKRKKDKKKKQESADLERVESTVVIPTSVQISSYCEESETTKKKKKRELLDLEDPIHQSSASLEEVHLDVKKKKKKKKERL